MTGLWAALPPLACYAVLGSSRLVSLGPESTTALMTAVAIGPLAAGDPSRYAALAALLALLVGLLAVVAWLEQVNSGDVAIAVAVLVFLFTAQSRWPRLPGPLVAVLLSTAVCAIFSLGQHGVALVGHIPAGLPAPGLPKVHLGDVRELILPALGVLLVAFSDDVLTARAFERDGEVIDANSELLALGVSNAGAGLLHGFPISSSGSRTAIGLAAGGEMRNQRARRGSARVGGGPRAPLVQRPLRKAEERRSGAIGVTTSPLWLRRGLMPYQVVCLSLLPGRQLRSAWLPWLR